MISKSHFPSPVLHLARWFIPLLALLLLALLRSLSAHGAGLQADIRYRPAPPVAGQPVTVEVTLSYANDKEALQAGSVFIGAIGPENGVVQAVELTRGAAVGEWTGQVTLPSEGLWTMQIRVELPGGTGQDRYNIQVAPAGTPMSNETGHFALELDLTAAATTPEPLWLRSWPLIAGVLIVVGLVLVFLFLPAAQPKDPEHST
ncbi:MAG TPA: hypothetical protein DEP84_17425 [Chloroflexi bacterium]|nr:hypothetical protein [Chloroflexota bacterium]